MEIKEKLQQLHAEENDCNIAIGQIDKEIKLLMTTKAKIAKRISANMKYRNRLIEKLPPQGTIR